MLRREALLCTGFEMPNSTQILAMKIVAANSKYEDIPSAAVIAKDAVGCRGRIDCNLISVRVRGSTTGCVTVP